MVTPEKYIRTMAKMTLMGMAQRVMNVGRRSFRKTNSTIMAKTAPSSRELRMDSTII